MQWITRGALMAFCSFGLITTAARAIHTAPAMSAQQAVFPAQQAVFEDDAVPQNIQRILAYSCQDCHSNETVWPWYANVFPMSKLVAADVEQGRNFWNMSNWQSYSKARKLGYLAAIANAVVEREMPPLRYTVLHAEARLSDAERHEIADWAGQESVRIRAQK